MLFLIQDCLRSTFKNKVKGQNTNCTLPWIQSMSGEISYNDSSKSNCNNSNSFTDMFVLGLQFSKQIAQYNESRCPGKFKLKCTKGI